MPKEIDYSVMNSDNKEEIFPIVDEKGNSIGKATRGECHNGSMLLHPVVHLHVFNSNGDLYLQRRPLWKDIQPGKWDTAVGGHVDYGERIEEALLREASEELGLKDFIPQKLEPYIFQSEVERELVNPFLTVCEECQVKPTSELDGGKFWTRNEILENLGKKIFTPNFESEYKRLHFDEFES